MLVTDSLARKLARHADVILPAMRGRPGRVASHGATLVCLEAVGLAWLPSRPRRCRCCAASGACAPPRLGMQRRDWKPPMPAKEPLHDTVTQTVISKVPAVTLGFWIIKILATTLGETGGDAATMTLGTGLSYWHSRSSRPSSSSPWLRRSQPSASIPSSTGSSSSPPLRPAPRLPISAIVRLASAMSADRRSCRDALSACWHCGLDTRFGRGQFDPLPQGGGVLIWATIMFSQTLGTALGDFLADTGGLGYEGGALVFGAALAVVAGLYFFTSVSWVALFWAAFILTRPLGATVGDTSTSRSPTAAWRSAHLWRRVCLQP